MTRGNLCDSDELGNNELGNDDDETDDSVLFARTRLVTQAIFVNNDDTDALLKPTHISL